MTTLTLDWGAGTRAVNYLGTDNLVSSYSSRTDIDRIDMKVAHVPLKAKAPSGSNLIRHDVSIVYRSYATPTSFATQINVSYSFTAAEDVDSAVLEYVTDALGNIALNDVARQQMLENAPVVD